MILKLLSSVLVLLSFSTVSIAQAGSPSDVMPLSTNSAKARHLMDKVWDLEADQVEQAKACVVLRKIVRIDPNFAVAHEILAQFSLDSAEQVSEQHQAFATKSHATAAEQEMVDWFEGAADHEWISAITNMNQLLKDYPHDRWVVLLANYWLGLENQYDRAIEVYE